MTPEIRAIADRFIYEQATVKLIATLAPEGALERPIPGHDWTVRQLLAHLAQSLNDYTDMIRNWLAGEFPTPHGWNPDDVNAATASRFAAAELDEIRSHFGVGLNSLVDALAAIPDERANDDFGPAPLSKTFEVLSGHCLEHAIPLVDAVPEVRMDALVLNWLLDASFPTEAGRQWQAELLREAREYVANHPDEEEDE
jgi:hypothetical protein